MQKIRTSSFDSPIKDPERELELSLSQSPSPSDKVTTSLWAKTAGKADEFRPAHQKRQHHTDNTLLSYPSFAFLTSSSQAGPGWPPGLSSVPPSLFNILLSGPRLHTLYL